MFIHFSLDIEITVKCLSSSESLAHILLSFLILRVFPYFLRTIVSGIPFLLHFQEVMASPVRVPPDTALLQTARSFSSLSENSLAVLKTEDGTVETLELVDNKPRLDSTDRALPGLYLSCFDMLFTEDATWLVRVADSSASVASGHNPGPCPEPEQCPVIDSPGLGTEPLSPGLEEQVEERSLEQVQSLVVGEVLKDIETACKLLNITPGKRLDH